METKELINKYKNSIFNIALILLALIIFSKIYKKQNETIESLQKQTQEAIKKNEVLEDLSQMEKKIILYNNLLSKKDSGSAINTIGNIAKETNIKIISIRPLQEQRYPEYIKIPFDLTVNAHNYHALGKFISRIENQQDVYLIDSMGISTDAQTKELTVNLKISTVVLTK